MLLDFCNGTTEDEYNCTDIYNCTEFIIYECDPITNALQVYGIPVIAVFGLIGNALAAAIFLTTKLKKRSSSVYLAALALADFGFLSGVAITHLSFSGVLDLYNYNILCQTVVYISSACSSLSVWLIVAFTTERFIVVQYPLHRHHVCTVSRARAVTFGVVLYAASSNLYVFWTAGIVQNCYGDDECEMLPEYTDFMRVVNYFDTAYSLVIPVIVITVFNCLIVRSLIVFRENNFIAKREDGSSSTTNTNSDKSFRSSHIRSTNDNPDERNISLVHYNRNILTANCQRNITKMLLLVSTAFIVLSVPSYIIRLYTFTLREFLDTLIPDYLWCVQQIVMILFYINHSINFLLYSMCGATFRQALVTLVKSKLGRLCKTCIRRNECCQSTLSILDYCTCN